MKELGLRPRKYGSRVHGFPHCMKELLAHSYHNVLTGLMGRELQTYLPPFSPVIDNIGSKKGGILTLQEGSLV